MRASSGMMPYNVTIHTMLHIQKQHMFRCCNTPHSTNIRARVWRVACSADHGHLGRRPNSCSTTQQVLLDNTQQVLMDLLARRTTTSNSSTTQQVSLATQQVSLGLVGMVATRMHRTNLARRTTTSNSCSTTQQVPLDLVGMHRTNMVRNSNHSNHSNTGNNTKTCTHAHSYTQT